MAKKQELIEVNEPRTLAIPAQGTAITSCPTNLDLTTFRGKALMLKAGGPSEYELEPGKPLRLIVTHWALMPDTRVDEESGECSEFVRTVLFDADGKTFRTSSAHSPLRLLAMLQLFTDNEWASGIPIIIEARKSKRGRMYHEINIDINERYGI